MRTILILISLTLATGAFAQGRGGAGSGFAGSGAGMSGGMSGGGGRDFGLGTAMSHAAPQASGPLNALSSGTPGQDLGSAVSSQTYRNGLDANQPVKPRPEKPSLRNTSQNSLNGPL